MSILNATPNTRSLMLNCNRCGSLIRLEVDVDCPDEWVSQLKPMVACNRCFDLRAMKGKATDLIAETCRALHEREQFGKPLSATELASVERTLTRGTKLYVRFLSELHRNPALPWDESIVGFLVSKPAAWETTLNDYRKQLTGKVPNENRSRD